jgi:hypothetical protein
MLCGMRPVRYASRTPRPEAVGSARWRRPVARWAPRTDLQQAVRLRANLGKLQHMLGQWKRGRGIGVGVRPVSVTVASGRWTPRPGRWLADCSCACARSSRHRVLAGRLMLHRSRVVDTASWRVASRLRLHLRPQPRSGHRVLAARGGSRTEVQVAVLLHPRTPPRSRHCGTAYQLRGDERTSCM